MFLQIAQRDDPPAKRRRLLESAEGGEGGAPEGEDLIAAVARKDVTEATLRSKLEAHIEQSDQDHGALWLPAAFGLAHAALTPHLLWRSA